MILIVDTNIIFAALLKDSTNRTLLINPPFILYTPESAINEIRRYEEEIRKRAQVSKEDFALLLALVTENIVIMEKEFYREYLEEADRLIGGIDKGDVPFLALALAMPNNGIWTENVRHFKSQHRIKILTTKELMNL